MILLIDNYDSFVFNLARYFRELGCEVEVVRNDQITVSDIASRLPGAIVLSPGPCTPNEAGICLEVVRQLGSAIPMLGVCLGHQVIAAALGGEFVRADEPVHGRTSLVRHDERRLFAGLPNPLRATRYHSLVVSENSLPNCLRPTARTADGVLMAFEHVEWPLFGVQFHPESVLTASGHQLLRNFLFLSNYSPREAMPETECDGSELRELVLPQSDDWTAVGPLHW
jgi:anthranilate synthase/aminodeoxychorismate synthase-like glutamine amidotransferase